MKSSKLVLAIGAFGLVRAFSACSSSSSPDAGDVVVSSVTPDHGLARGGDLVTIHGSGFGATPVVRFGDRPAIVKSSTDGAIEVIAPEAQGGTVDVEVDVGAESARLTKSFTYQTLPMTFVDVSWQRVKPLAVNGAGLAIADADGDGHPDVFQAAGTEGVWLYKNDGKGRFLEPKLIATPASSDVRFVLARDFDGDGSVDLFLGASNQTPSVLLWGDGKGGFMASKSSLPALFGSGQTAAAADLDGDGDLDLVTSGASVNPAGTPGVAVLSNRGARSFKVVTTEDLADAVFSSSGVVAGDVDGDGDSDLFFAVDKESSRLYLNDGHGIFEHAPPDAFPAAPLGAGIPAMGDLDGDGSLDLYVPSSGQDRVLFNDGKGRFTDLTELHLGPESALGISATLADFDMDGRLDVAVVEVPGVLRLYRNDASGRFFDYSAQIAGEASTLSNAAVAAADFDGDGAADLFVSRSDFSRAALFTGSLTSSIDDADGDGVPDSADNCTEVPNPEQTNLDSLPFGCESGASCKTATGCDLEVFGASAYLVCKTPTAWTKAEALCAARGAHLVTVSSAAENAFLTSLDAGAFWIGDTDAAKEGTFVWTGAQSAYTNWGMGQPDNASSNENCVELAADGTWNDIDCANTFGFVCEDVRAKAPDPGDACDPCPATYDPESHPVAGDAGVAAEDAGDAGIDSGDASADGGACP